MVEPDPDSRARRNYWLLIASCVGLQITSSTIYMVLPLFFQNCGISNSGVGILISVGTFGGVLSGVLAGKLSDRHGRKPFLLLGGFLYSLVFFLFAFLGKNFLTFFVLRFIEGFGFFIIPVVVVSMASDTFPPIQLGRAIALFSVSTGIGQLIGPIFAGYFLEAADFITYFIFCGLFSLLSLTVFFFVRETLDQGTGGHGAPSERTGFLGGVRRFWDQTRGLGRFYLIFLGAVLVYRVGYTMVDPLFSLFLKNVLHLNMSSMSYLFAVRALCTILFAPVCGYCADRIGRKPTFLAGMALGCLTMIAYTTVDSYGSVMVVRILDSISVVVLLTVIRTIIADLVQPALRGFGQGLASSISQESSTIGAIFGGVVSDLLGFNGIFLCAAAGAATALGIVSAWVPESSASRRP